MLRRRAVVLAAALAGVALAPGVASAHKMELTATVQAAVRVVVGYEGDEPAEGARVTLAGASSAVVAEGTSDDKGVCVLPRPPAGTYTVAANDGQGHRASVELVVPESAEEVATAQTARRNRWLTMAAGLGVIGGGTAVLWLRRNGRGRPGTMAPPTGGQP